jgi:hypothetical protein
MQQLAEAVPTTENSSTTFAGLLASLAAPKPAPSLPSFFSDGLADDVATLSYESALRAHSRFKPSEIPASSLDRSGLATARPDTEFDAELGTGPDADSYARDAACGDAKANADSIYRPGPAQDSNLKCASITIRLSKSECEQLRRRAADAGLTVSAYLRSCTFEAESLRAQVKQALAELRASSPAEKQGASAKPRRAKPGWLRRLFQFALPAPRAARA